MVNEDGEIMICDDVIVISDDEETDLTKGNHINKKNGQVDSLIENSNDEETDDGEEPTNAHKDNLCLIVEISDDEGYEERRSFSTSYLDVSVGGEHLDSVNELSENCKRKSKKNTRRFNKLVRDKKLLYPFQDLLLLTKMLHQNPVVWKSRHEERVKYNRAMIEFGKMYNDKCKIFKFKADLSQFIDALKQAFNAQLIELSTQPTEPPAVLTASRRCECEVCQAFMFSDLRSVIEHQRQHEDRLENVYHCKVCLQCFGFQKLIVNYVQLTLEDGKSIGNIEAVSMAPKVQCTKCTKSYFHDEMLKAHMHFAHQTSSKQDVQYKCKLCQKAFATYLKCRLHVRRQHQCRILWPQFHCFVCGQSFWKKASRRRHFKEKHTINTKFECKPCKCSYHLVWNLWRHKQREHKKPKICFICGKLNYKSSLCTTHTVPEREFYIENRKDAYAKPIELVNSKTYECSYCKRRYPQRLLAQHMQCHLPGVFACDAEADH